LQVINWAYRGKDGVECWTGEKEYISGIRMALDDLRELIKKQDEQQDIVIFVAFLDGRYASKSNLF
jgi:hypothetical protein